MEFYIAGAWIVGIIQFRWFFKDVGPPDDRILVVRLHFFRCWGLWPLGLVIALPLYSLLSLFGAFLGWPAGTLIRRFFDGGTKIEPSVKANGTSPRR